MNEMLKALAEFGRSNYILSASDFEFFFNGFSHELLVRTCYNLVLDVHQQDSVQQYTTPYTIQARIIGLIDKWLNSNESDRPAIEGELMDTGRLLVVFIQMNNPFYCAYAAAAIPNFESGSGAKTLAASVAQRYCEYMFIWHSEYDNKKILIKTICDYYKLDFETFKALYLS
jgi:hypothetical protein